MKWNWLSKLIITIQRIKKICFRTIHKINKLITFRECQKKKMQYISTFPWICQCRPRTWSWCAECSKSWNKWEKCTKWVSWVKSSSFTMQLPSLSSITRRVIYWPSNFKHRIYLLITTIDKRWVIWNRTTKIWINRNFQHIKWKRKCLSLYHQTRFHKTIFLNLNRKYMIEVFQESRIKFHWRNFNKFNLQNS